MTKLLKSIHSNYAQYMNNVHELERELLPYLEEYLCGESAHIFIAEDEGCRLFLVHPISAVRYEITKDHIKYIKKNKKLNEDLGRC